MVDMSEAQRTLRTINGRSRLPFDKGEIILLQDRVTDLNYDILQNLEDDIADTRGTYIPQSEKPDLINSAWVAPLQNQVKVSGFDLPGRPRLSPAYSAHVRPGAGLRGY